LGEEPCDGFHLQGRRCGLVWSDFGMTLKPFSRLLVAHGCSLKQTLLRKFSRRVILKRWYHLAGMAIRDQRLADIQLSFANSEAFGSD
jgi:heme exporter protein D